MTAADYTRVGAFNVDGKWATAIRFEATITAEEVAHVRLRFMNGRSGLAEADLAADDAQRLLGPQNYEVILKAAAAAQGADSVKGEIRGKYLMFRQVALAPASAVAENTIEADERVPVAKLEATQGTAPEVQAPVEASEPVSEPTASIPTPAAVPPWVKQRFLNVGNHYYFPDRTLAFTDDGLKLKAESHNTEVVRGVLAIAEARNWTSIRVNGSIEFRREVWRQAQLLGINVRGYEPSDVEKAASSQAPTGSRQPAAAQEEPVQNVAVPGAAASRPAADRTITGVLSGAGAAPYRFDETKGLSYYLKLQTANGERTLWGADLERAMVESTTAVKIGDTVSIENQGAKPVTVKELRRDGDGKVIETTVAAQRQRWLVEKPEYFVERAARADAFREGGTSPSNPAASHPDVAAAAVNLWISEQLAARHVERAEDRDRVIMAVKDRLATALERGEAIPAPRLREEGRRRLDALRGGPTSGGQPPRSRSVRVPQRDAREFTPEGR